MLDIVGMQLVRQCIETKVGPESGLFIWAMENVSREGSPIRHNKVRRSWQPSAVFVRQRCLAGMEASSVGYRAAH